MKKMLFVLSLLCSFTLHAQETYRIKSLAECNNDTLEYIRTNFVGHEDRYVNKPFSKFLADFNLNTCVLGGPVKEALELSIVRMSYINYLDEHIYLFKSLPMYYFYVEFKPPFLDSGETLERAHGKDRIYGTYFSNCIIKEMKFIYQIGEYTEPKDNGYWKGERMN